MIPHPLIRNFLIPFFMVLYCIHSFSDRNLSRLYSWIYGITLFLSVSIVLGIGLKGLEYYTSFISGSWSSEYSVYQYLVYFNASTYYLFQKTGDSPFSYTLSLLATSTIGYLYEVPRWLQWGIRYLIRTSKYSFIMFDFGMLSIMFLIFIYVISRDYDWKQVKFFKTSIVVYLLYCTTYYFYKKALFRFLWIFLPMPKTFFLRLPSMFMITLFLMGFEKASGEDHDLLQKRTNLLGEKREKGGIYKIWK